MRRRVLPPRRSRASCHWAVSRGESLRNQDYYHAEFIRSTEACRACGSALIPIVPPFHRAAGEALPASSTVSQEIYATAVPVFSSYLPADTVARRTLAHIRTT